MKNKVIIITGATSGIGKVSAIELAKLGAKVVMLVRNTEKGEKLKERIQLNEPGNQVDIIECDLASLDSVKKASEEVRKKYNRVDVLINNAGAIFSRRVMSHDGYELTFAVNHLGHFLLTTELLDLVTKTPGSRIINVSSGAHQMGKLDFDDLMFEKKYSPIKAYANAKLANIYFTYELDRRLKGTDTTVNAMHPGAVRTNFGNDFKGLWRILFWISRPFMRSPEKGAETLIFLASSNEVNGISGKYFKDKKELQSSDISYNEESARRLWEVSEKLIKDF